MAQAYGLVFISEALLRAAIARFFNNIRLERNRLISNRYLYVIYFVTVKS